MLATYIDLAGKKVDKALEMEALPINFDASSTFPKYKTDGFVFLGRTNWSKSTLSAPNSCLAVIHLRCQSFEQPYIKFPGWPRSCLPSGPTWRRTTSHCSSTKWTACVLTHPHQGLYSELMVNHVLYWKSSIVRTEKQNLIAIYVECTKVDTALNHLISRARTKWLITCAC